MKKKKSLHPCLERQKVQVYSLGFAVYTNPVIAALYAFDSFAHLLPAQAYKRLWPD